MFNNSIDRHSMTFGRAEPKPINGNSSGGDVSDGVGLSDLN